MTTRSKGSVVKTLNALAATSGHRLWVSSDEAGGRSIWRIGGRTENGDIREVVAYAKEELVGSK